MGIAALLRRVDQSGLQLRQIEQAVAELHEQATAIAALLNGGAADGRSFPRLVASDGQALDRQAPHRQADIDAMLIDAVEAALISQLGIGQR